MGPMVPFVLLLHLFIKHALETAFGLGIQVNTYMGLVVPLAFLLPVECQQIVRAALARREQFSSMLNMTFGKKIN